MNCSSARKLLCGGCGRLGLCGLGCIVHHVSRCLVTAYLSNRTMILDCSGMSYSSRGWDAAFLPITNCTRTQMDEGSIAGDLSSYY